MPRNIRTLDLFSGIGGITHALRGAATPVAYCDSSDIACAVLNDLMGRGLIPRAPICKDVRRLDAEWLRANKCAHPDMIVGGFPCVGFSAAGHRLGYENDQSALFYEILRLVDLTSPLYVFLENVPGILQLGMGVVANELCVKRGFRLSWCTLAASQVGAPHKRLRWYCLAVKDGATAPPPPGEIAPYVWTRRSEPERATCAVSVAASNRRVRLLGNSVVPDAVRRVRASAPRVPGGKIRAI
jgi:site-specific DNA-cytosine methylase